MSLADTRVTPTLKGYAYAASTQAEEPPRRTAPFDHEPGFHQPAGLWLYGNARLLAGNVAYIEQALGPCDQEPDELDEIDRKAEELVLQGKVLVSGIHNPAHQRVALVPLRWGAPRIIVFSGGFYYHLGKELKDEPFRAARLWRYQWDKSTDLAISRRAPTKLPTFARCNSTVDRLVQRLGRDELPGLRWYDDSEVRVLV